MHHKLCHLSMTGTNDAATIFVPLLQHRKKKKRESKLKCTIKRSRPSIAVEWMCTFNSNSACTCFLWHSWKKFAGIFNTIFIHTKQWSMHRKHLYSVSVLSKVVKKKSLFVVLVAYFSLHTSYVIVWLQARLLN